MPISDDSVVKHSIVLAPPTLCDERLYILYKNQFSTLDDVRDADAEEEYTQQKVRKLITIKYNDINGHARTRTTRSRAGTVGLPTIRLSTPTSSRSPRTSLTGPTNA